MLDRCWSVLAGDERARHDRFLFEKDRHLYLISHALVRWALSQYDQVSPAEWRFVENDYGRPEVAPDQNRLSLRFNLTHTTGLVACAVTEGFDIGVDAEAVGRATLDIMALARATFAPREVVQIEALSAESQRSAFLSLWTLKESYIKARGMGLSLPLKDFSFELRPDGPPVISFEGSIRDDPAAWQFRQIRPTAEHTLAVAVKKGLRPELPIEVRETVPLL